MNTILRFSFLISVVVLFYSCSTTQTISISAPDGTEIYTPTLQRLASAASGTAQVKVTRDAYYAYLLARPKGTDEYVPFALDYQNKSYTGLRALNGTLWTAGTVGLVLEVAGVLAEANGDSEVSPSLIIPGTTLILGGMLPGIGTMMRLQKKQMNFCFKYLPRQQTNLDMSFTQPDWSGAKRRALATAAAAAPDTAAISATPAPVVAGAALISKKDIRSLAGNPAQQAEGTYTGSGRLTAIDGTTEIYNHIKMVLKSAGRKTATLEIFDADGDPFFEKPLACSVSRKDDGSLVLSLKSQPNAQIIINDGGLQYTHPGLTINGLTYTLQINGSVQH